MNRTPKVRQKTFGVYYADIAHIDLFTREHSFKKDYARGLDQRQHYARLGQRHVI